MQTGKELYELFLSTGAYPCHCAGGGLYLDEKTQEVDVCPECDSVNQYMRENKIGWYEDKEPERDYGRGIPF